MEQFTILANESWCDLKGGGRGKCLNIDTKAFYHSVYHGGGDMWKIKGSIENMVCTFKNDITRYSEDVLKKNMSNFEKILIPDITQIAKLLNLTSVTVCVIPRAKREEHYRDDQKLFRQTITNVIKSFNGNVFVDGTHNIIRHTDTPTTHLRQGRTYKGITTESCDISNVYEKDILLIDDLYTKSIGVDEDAIQALYDNGAKNVIFYSIGKTGDRFDKSTVSVRPISNKDISMVCEAKVILPRLLQFTLKTGKTKCFSVSPYQNEILGESVDVKKIEFIILPGQIYVQW